MSSPGKLAASFFEPGEYAGVHPIRLYLTINVLFFFLAPWINSNNISVWQVEHQAALEMLPAMAELLERAVGALGPRRTTSSAPSWMSASWPSREPLVWLLIPVMALGTFAVARGRRPYLVEHLTFATYLVSYLLVAILVAGLAGRLALLPSVWSPKFLMVAAGVLLLWLVWVALSFYRSCKIFFGFQRRWVTVVFTCWLGTAFSAGFWLYMQALFLLALFGLRDLSL